MPYIVHPKDTEPTDECERYPSRMEAYRVAPTTSGLVITFVISEDERREWRTREYQRFHDNVYTLPPWIAELYWLWEPHDMTDQSYKYPKLTTHFAHLSLKQPGCIAYTPSDESGYQDKQTTIKVGRYLEEHARDYFTQEQINRFVDTVKGFSADLQLATTAEDIETVYRNSHGTIGSCMSHPTDEYRTQGIHPTAVYGDSDLALAYLGSMSAPSARCIVWPAKKRYTRIYGDTTLKAVLQKSGYEYVDGVNGYGNLDGAKIRAIKVPGRSSVWVMPYVDAAQTADRDGDWFVLCDDDEGEFDVHNADYVDGITHVHRSNTCEHCGTECDDGDTYCSSCEDDRISCERCGDTFFDVSDGEQIDGNWYCDNCASRYCHECEGCNDSWYEINPDSAYCEACRDHYTSCDECGESFDTRETSSVCLCDDCHKATDDTPDEQVEPAAEPTPPILTEVYPSIDAHLFVYLGGIAAPIRVEILYTVGAFAVHERAEDDIRFPHYTVTHIPSGRVAGRDNELHLATYLARLLSTPGIDWGFVRQEDCPSSTRELANYIVRSRELPSGDSNIAMLFRMVTSTQSEVSL